MGLKLVEMSSVGRASVPRPSPKALGQLSELLSWCPSVLRKGGYLVLWLGEDDAKRTARLRGFSWRPPVLVPGSKRRFLLVGQLIA